MNRLISLLLIIPFAISCSDAEKERLQRLEKELRKNNDELREQITELNVYKERMDFWANNMKDVRAVIKTNMGDIEVEFFPEIAPIHCFNFITRAESGFYDGTTFHRVMKGFMIQGGDPNSKDSDPSNDGQGGPLVNVPHEFSATKHVPGILSMARVPDESQGAGCQFFIMHAVYPSLDNKYTVFGKVVGEKDLEVVDKIANVNVNKKNNRPLSNVVIKTIEIKRL